MAINLGLDGKVAVVTGAGGGIGREIALALAAEGVSIVVNDIGVSLSGDGGSESPAQETSGLITQKGGKAVISNESVSSWSSAQLIIKKAVDTFGKIDIVVKPTKYGSKKNKHKHNKIITEKFGIMSYLKILNSKFRLTTFSL